MLQGSMSRSIDRSGFVVIMERAEDAAAQIAIVHGFASGRKRSLTVIVGDSPRRFRQAISGRARIAPHGPHRRNAGKRGTLDCKGKGSRRGERGNAGPPHRRSQHGEKTRRSRRGRPEAAQHPRLPQSAAARWAKAARTAANTG